MRSSQTSGFCAILDSCEMAQESDISFFSPFFLFVSVEWSSWSSAFTEPPPRAWKQNENWKRRFDRSECLCLNHFRWLWRDSSLWITSGGQETIWQCRNVPQISIIQSSHFLFPIRDVSLFQSNSKQSLAASYISFCLFVISWNLKTLIQSSSMTANFYVKRLLSLC